MSRILSNLPFNNKSFEITFQSKTLYIFSDAFRGPLASAFKLHLEDVALFRDPKTGIDTDHLCLRTDGIADKYRHWATKTNILTDYGCLLLSPANLWQRDPRSFQFDANVISTVFNYQRHSIYIWAVRS